MITETQILQSVIIGIITVSIAFGIWCYSNGVFSKEPLTKNMDGNVK